MSTVRLADGEAGLLSVPPAVPSVGNLGYKTVPLWLVFCIGSATTIEQVLSDHTDRHVPPVFATSHGFGNIDCYQQG